MKPWSYRGRWALITGASAGIGEEFARQLAGRGMNLVLAARREERLRETGGELERRFGVATLPLAADLARPDEAARLWRAASQGRTIHLLVNNAGFGAKGPFHEIPRERQAEMVRVNCIAPLELAHLALHAMRALGEGGILNVASVAAYQPIPNLATYAATKAFLLTLSEALTEESRAAGVRVVALNPGPVATEFQAVAGTRVNERTPGIRTPAQVVEEALRALEEGRASVTPGLINRLGTLAGRMAPRNWVVRAAKQVIKRGR